MVKKNQLDFLNEIKKNDMAHLNVNRKFFDNIFERDRKKTERKLGISLSQNKFTKLLLKSDIQLIPKLNMDVFKDVKNKRKKG